MLTINHCLPIIQQFIGLTYIFCILLFSLQTPIPELTVLYLDLASLQSIEQFAEKFKSLNM